jgi:hypothetical protein
MTPLSFSVRRNGGSQHLHYETAERAAFAAIRLAESEPDIEFILTAHSDVPHILTSAQERGHARAASLSPRERTEIARIAAVARAASLSPERRSEIARAASLARWRGDREPEAPAQ